jgi:hypothetical protein
MSYFNHPVKVAVFQASMIGIVERLLRKAGKQESVRIQVLFTGEQACAIWSYNGSMVRGTIKLPDLKAGSVIDREKANRWVAYVIHEVWHVVFTDSYVYQNFAMNYPGLRTALANAIEDARIERSGMALGYADGFQIVGKDLLAHLMVTGGMDVNPNDPRQIPWAFAVGCRGYGVKGERRLLSALDSRIRAILDEAKRRQEAIPVESKARDGTMAVCAIALWAYEELKKLGSALSEPPQPKGPQPKGGTPGPQDDEPPVSEDDSEREAGEAGEYDDEGTEGDGEGEGEGGGDVPPPPLKVGDTVRCPDGTKGVITEINDDLAEVAPL